MKTTNIDNKGKAHNSKDILISDCIFPFKFKSKEHNECVKGKTGDWCATEVSKTGTKKRWAYCVKSGSKASAKKQNNITSPKPKKVVTKKKAKKEPPKKQVKVSKSSRYFEAVEGGAFKFWILEPINKYDVKVTFGKIGSEGRESVQYFDSEEERVRYINKKVAEKIRKGYQEVSKSSNRTNVSKKPKSVRKPPVKAENKVEAVNTSTKTKISSKSISCDSKKWKQVWNVKKNGVMLAHTFRDPKTGKIKNPPKGYPQAPDGWHLSEKFDGYRCIWDGENFYSRNGNIFVTPDWFKAYMPAGVALDGELFLGRECFQQCGLFRRKIPDNEEWISSNVKYQVFDSPTHPGGFEDRMKFIEKIIKDRCKCDKKKLGIPSKVSCPLVMTKQIKVKTEEDVQKHFSALTKMGAEGVMLRAPNSPYESKRTSLLLKVKQLFDAECKIIGYKPGTGKYKDMLGAFECQLVKDKKIKFTISGMDDSIRQNYKKTHPIGTIVTFTYMGTSTSGIPRHPNYLRIRKGKY